MRRAVYPGSFDPFTFGHLDVLERAKGLFDEVIVAIAVNPNKKSLFTVEERIHLLRQTVNHESKVKVDAFEGLTVEYARQQKARYLIRGLRAISDFESELAMASLNKQMEPTLETVFLMTSANYSFLSSTAVKEVARMRGPLKDMVPPIIEEALRKKFK